MITLYMPECRSVELPKYILLPVEDYSVMSLPTFLLTDNVYRISEERKVAFFSHSLSRLRLHTNIKKQNLKNSFIHSMTQKILEFIIIGPMMGLRCEIRRGKVDTTAGYG